MTTTAAAAPVVVAPTSEQIVAYQQWYQQQYLQYVSQYMAYMSTLQQQQQPQYPAAPHPVQWMGMPNFAHLPQSNVASAAAANPVLQPGAQVAGQEEQLPQPAAPAPRFPMLVHDPERPERDWLDHVNTMCRISFLLLMIYFYSSALRFAIVMCAIFAVFFYRNRRAFVGMNQRAVLPPLQPPPAPPVVVDNEPVGAVEAEAADLVEAAAAAEATPPVVDRPVGHPDNNNNHLDVANRNAGETNGQQPNNNNNATVLSFLRTFVTSFFYSLLPEPAMAP